MDSRNRSSSRLLFPLATLLSMALLARCGGGRPVHYDPDAKGGALAGLVVKGPLSGGTVTAYILDPSGTRKSALGTAPTDTVGAFRIENVPAYNGALLLVATGGSYAEEAEADTTVRLGSAELTYLLPNYEAGSTVEGLTVTPISHFAAGLTVRHVQADGQAIAAASDEAWIHLNNHFGGLLAGGMDWRKVVPADFTVASSGQLDRAGKAGLILAGLSMQARGIAEKAGVTPGGAMNSLALVEALYDDLTADGFFDGQGASGQLLLPSGGFVADAGPTAYPLDGQTLRFALGQALERFMRSPRNATALTASDALPLIQQLTSNSDDRLFRAAGINYDHEPPVMDFTVTWTRTDGVSHQPVGTAQLVGGSLTVTVKAADASTIQSLSLSANGRPVTVIITGSGNFIAAVGTFTTGADGPLTFTAHGADVHGNAGDASYTVAVDNTPPAIALTPGSPASTTFYSSSVPVEAVASDANGIAGFELAGLSGFTNQAQGSRISGTWAIAAGTPDGTVTGTFTATDPVLNTTSVAVPISIDRTPPQVALVAPLPPRYTNDGASGATTAHVTLHVSATDSGAGVGGVTARIGAIDFPGTFDPAKQEWSIPVDLNVGHNFIDLWASDQASPSNGGLGKPAFVTSTIVTYDTAPPDILSAGLASFFSEEFMDIERVGSLPTMPAVYTFPAGIQRKIIDDGFEIIKASTRVSWGGTPPPLSTLTQQDAAHGTNFPFIAITVPYNALVDAPITSVVYSIVATCAGCSTQPAIGALWVEPAPSTRYILPLTLDTIPALVSATGPAQLAITITALDQAGNSKQRLITGTYRVIGPPLAWAEDLTSTWQSDPKSAFPYHVADGSYASAFNASNPAFGPDGTIRLIRYIIRNPAPYPVALNPVLTSPTWQAVEQWNDSAEFLNTSIAYTAPDGTPLQREYVYAPDPWCGIVNTYWCPGHAGMRYYPSSTVPACDDALPPVTATNPELPETQAVVSAAAYLNPQPSGSETVAAQRSNVGDFIVPPAIGATPGSLTLYLTRPSTGLPSRRPLIVQDLNPTIVPIGFQVWKLDWWRSAGFQSCGRDDQGYEYGTDSYPAHRWLQYLARARSQIDGTMTITTAGIVPGGSTRIGESRNYSSPTTITRSIPH